MGWYCAWVAAVSLAISLVVILRDGDVKLGTIWLLWTLLFAMFFLVFGLDVTAMRSLTGWITITESVITAAVPGLLILLGLWNDVPDLAVVGVAATTTAVFTLMGLRAARTASCFPTR
jgi:FtsH-binding integral membrane protein